MISAESFGTVAGRAVYRYTLQNACGTQVKVLTLAGIVQEFSVEQAGKRQNLVMSLPTAQAYADNVFQVCKQIGRVAGRIAGGQFMLNNSVVKTPVNENGNTLHGGADELSTKILDATVDGDTLTLTHEFLAADDGFPGDCQFSIDYELDDDNRLTLTYHAAAKADTVIDPTLHIYWALEQNFAKTRLWLSDSQRLELDSQKLPTGVLLDEPLFKAPQSLRAALDFLKLKGQSELDDAFFVNADKTGRIAQLWRVDGIKINIYSQRNGLIVFTANPFAPNKPFNCLATEAQTLPDAVHHHKFGDISLMRGTKKTWKISYQVELPQ